MIFPVAMEPEWFSNTTLHALIPARVSLTKGLCHDDHIVVCDGEIA